MQFTVNQKDLKELVKKLSYFRYRNYVPIHEMVEIFIDNKNVVFREVSRNPKGTAEVVCACALNNVKNIDTEGSDSEEIFISFDKLKKYVNATEKNSDITISCWSKDNPHLVEYKTITGTFSLNNNFIANTFPSHENVPKKCKPLQNNKTTYTVDRGFVDYQKVADLMGYACDENDSRESLATIKMTLNEDNITYEATDAHILAKLQQKVNFEEQLKKSIQAVIPVKVFSGLGHKEFNDYDKIIFSESPSDNFAHITFAKDNYNYVLVHYNMETCVDYPDIEHVIPQANKTTVSFNKSALSNLLSAIKKCSIVGKDSEEDVSQLILDNNKKTLTIRLAPQSKNVDINKESFKYTLKDIEGLELQGADTYTINVSNSLLLSTFKAVKFKDTKPCTYTMCFNTESNLTPLAVVNTEVKDYVQVVAPTRDWNNN